MTRLAKSRVDSTGATFSGRKEEQLMTSTMNSTDLTLSELSKYAIWDVEGEFDSN